MSFKDVPRTSGVPKHLQIVDAVKAVDEEESQALWEIITDYQVSADQASKAIRDEMSKYTDDPNLQTLSSRQILRIRQGLVK